MRSVSALKRTRNYFIVFIIVIPIALIIVLLLHSLLNLAFGKPITIERIIGYMVDILPMLITAGIMGAMTGVYINKAKRDMSVLERRGHYFTIVTIIGLTCILLLRLLLNLAFNKSITIGGITDYVISKFLPLIFTILIVAEIEIRRGWKKKMNK